MSYLVDSDVLMSALNGRLTAASLLRRHQHEGLSISYVSVGEIFDGVLGSSEPERNLETARIFLDPFDLLTLNDAAMLRFAQLRVDLRRQGQLIPDFDLLIAATALVHALTLNTGNQRHFQRVPGLALEGYE